MTQYTLVIAIFMLQTFIGAKANAQNKILKVSEKTKKVGISLNEGAPLKVGDIVEASVSNDEPCKIKIVKVSSKMAIGSASCEFVEELKDQEVKLVSGSTDSLDAELDDEGEIPATAEKKRELKPKKLRKHEFFGVTLFYNLADKIESKGKMGGTSFTETDKMETGPGIGVHYLNSQKNRLGSFVMLDYELPKKLKSYTGNIGGIPVSGTVSGATISILSLTSNLTYGLSTESFLYGGINYPFKIEAKKSEVDFDGQIGFQFGSGYRFSDRLMIGLEYKMQRARGSFIGRDLVTGQPVSSTYDEVKFDGLLFRLGVNF